MVAALLGFALIVLTLSDCFQTLLLSRRISRRWRLTKFYFRVGWGVWSGVCRRSFSGRARENALSVFGPLALVGLFVCWAALLITGFGLVQWGVGSPSGKLGDDLRQCLYHSGETFFTLGYGDVTPDAYFGKAVAVVEAGMGFGFMAIVIGYLPVLYQAFSKREQGIALLDARAGSPPTALELFRRLEGAEGHDELMEDLAAWERWTAQLLESHLSYPLLSFYRSQHDNQNWLAALALVLDASAVAAVVGDASVGQATVRRRAERTFALARRTCEELCLVFWLPTREPEQDRLTDEEAEELLALAGGGAAAEGWDVARLRELRRLYEPYVATLAEHLQFRVPRFVAAGEVRRESVRLTLV